MSIQSLNQQASRFYSVQNLEVAAEGPRCVPFIMDFSQYDEYTLDMQNIMARNFLSMIQSIWIDNSVNTVAFTASLPTSGQDIITAPGRQSYKQILCPNPARMTFTSPGGGIVKIQLLNFPVTNSDWPVFTGA